MRIGMVPESLLERFALAAGAAPTALAESWFTFELARAIMIGVRLGIFEALEDGPRTAAEVAERCHTNPHATEKLLVALVGCRHLALEGGRYALTPASRRWLLGSSPGSVRDKILLQFLEWDWWMRAEEYVRTGQPLKLHEMLGDEEWGVYQRGMRAGGVVFTREVVRRLRLPPGARDMLDIGGSHGYWSVCFCRRHPGLRSTILDLPQAVRHAAPILAREGMGDRVAHRTGDALVDDLGSEAWDFVFLASLVHHFDDAQNRALMKRVARALRPGGVVAIFDAFRISPGDAVGQIGGLMDLFFALTSASGTWAPDEIAGWQRDAGLVPRRAMRSRMAHDIGWQAADKPR
jgi:SAM-dependent methyltransferase